MSIFKILLFTHILCGALSLLLGMFVLVLKKGNQLHKRIGNIYFYALLLASLVALPMSYLHPSYFLFVIAVFTSYMLLTGKRYINKSINNKVTTADWILTVTMFLFGIAFMAFGIFNLVKQNYFGTVLLVFGGISLLFVYQDFINFTGKSSAKNYWLTTHLQRMIGSYVASVTAFLVVNNTILSGMAAWLLPTLLIVPLIVKWTRKYKLT